MQQVELKAAIANGSGKLGIDQIPTFRKFLGLSGLTVRDGSGDQFFHVRLPGSPRWVPVERGRGGAPVIRGALQAYLDQFLSCPAPAIEAVFSLANISGTEPEFPVELVKALSHPQLGQYVQDLPVIERCTNSPITDQGSAIHGDRQLCPTAKSVDDAQYLSDLRDDFAVHAPIFMPVSPSSADLENHINARWAYADLMMKRRAMKSGD